MSFLFSGDPAPCRFFLCVLCAFCANPVFSRHANLKVGVPRAIPDVPRQADRLEVSPTSYPQSFLRVLRALCANRSFERLGTPDFSPACFFQGSPIPCPVFLRVLRALCANPFLNLWNKRKPRYRAVAKRKSTYAAMPFLYQDMPT